jgi:membrane fusion protein (multidrug efflux system)
MEIQVPQERISAVHRDQAVEVRVDAYPDRVFAATVRYISAAVRADSRSLIVEALVPNADGALRPGLFATARV